MYHETYHPLEGDNLDEALCGLSEEDKAKALEQINAANEQKLRNYRVELVPPDGDYKGRYFVVENGQIVDSSDLGGK